MSNIRKEVLWFATEMNEILDSKEDLHPKGWSEDTNDELADKMGAKVNELYEVLEYEEFKNDKILKLSIDIANYAMMIADKNKF
jgi:hypothetical protein